MKITFNGDQIDFLMRLGQLVMSDEIRIVGLNFLELYKYPEVLSCLSLFSDCGIMVTYEAQ